MRLRNLDGHDNCNSSTPFHTNTNTIPDTHDNWNSSPSVHTNTNANTIPDTHSRRCGAG